MSFKLPKKLCSKRASSFQSKKLPIVSLTEESDSFFYRQKSSMPNTTKNSRALSYIEVKSPQTTPSKNNLHQRIYEAPKSRAEMRSHSIADVKSSYINELIDKVTSQKPHTSKINEEIKKLQDLHSQKVQTLNDEIEKLQKQLKAMKSFQKSDRRKDKIIQDMRQSSEMFKSLLEIFVKEMKVVTEKLCNYITLVTSRNSCPEITGILTNFNKSLGILTPILGEQTVLSTEFVVCESDALQYTGRFRSLGDTQNSFGGGSMNVAPKEVIALDTYQSAHYGELSFKAGDRIVLVKTDDPNSWLGKIGERIGRIPAQLVMLD